MRRVCRDYAAIFDEIEENPSCVIHWNVADRAVIGKPLFIPLDRINCVQPQPDAAKSEEPVNADLRLSLVENYDAEELPSVSSRLDGIETNSEFLNTGKSEASLEPDLIGSTCRMTDLSSVVVEKQQDGHQLDRCCVDDGQNCEGVSADCASGNNRDTAVVISSDTLPENSQPPKIGLPG